MNVCIVLAVVLALLLFLSQGGAPCAKGVCYEMSYDMCYEICVGPHEPALGCFKGWARGPTLQSSAERHTLRVLMSITSVVMRQYVHKRSDLLEMITIQNVKKR